MSYLIAIDDGHGMQTAGKRTPILPSGYKSETGNFMHENEFNRKVAYYLNIELKRCGFNTILVAPTDADTSLAQRVNTANNAKAHFYISIHANANTSTWGNWGGIETYTYKLSGASYNAGKIIHKYLMQGTPLKDRGVKDGSGLYVIRNTNMPAVLVELGFMDSLTDFKYLLMDSYRRECAIEICKGICEYFGVAYKGGTVSKPAAATQTTAPSTKPASTHIGVATNSGQINVYSKPDTMSYKRKLDKGSWKVYGISNKMYSVSTNEWIQGAEMTSSVTFKQRVLKITNAGTINCYSKPDTNCYLKKLGAGTSWKVWGFTTVNGVTWVALGGAYVQYNSALMTLVD